MHRRIAVVAATAVIAVTPPVAASAETVSDAETDHPRITTVDRTEELSPEGDTVTVSGAGHEPGSRIEVSTWAAPAGTGAADDAAETGDEAVHDADHAVTVDVGERGAFTVTLDTGTGFAVDAGLDAAEDPFEIRLVEVGPAPESPQDTEAPDTGGPADDAPPTGSADRTDTDGDAHAADTAPPGAGMSKPVLAPGAPATAPVVARVPITFAAPASAPNVQPNAQSQTRTQTQTTLPPATVPSTRETPTLSVSQTSGLDPDGQTVTVTGSGYDTSKGVYVALCDTSRAGAAQAPSPCIGGVDMDGSSGSSVWVSSNPPPYGEGLAVPYDGRGTDGGFSVELTVRASDAGTDCTDASTECAVVTRNDHTRSSDRSQDVFVPVTFAGQDGGSGNGSGGGADGSGSGSGSDSAGSGGSGSGNAENGGDEGIGTLPTTGSALWALVLAAVVATVTGAAALVATRRPRDTAAT
ncbi:cell wall protein [Nocardiopsis sp. NPDC050513]|uniref:cell wall protein n=1 Tax=Nocardiopsis sp. NPDC050513 TaxID=3364338 RepID=UPI0037AE3619